MKTLRKIQVKVEMVDSIPELKDIEENTIYISALYKTASHKCLCGCGNESVTPIDIRTGWSYSIGYNFKLTMTPSILNTHCPNRYHYIITDGVANVV